MHGIWEVLKTD